MQKELETLQKESIQKIQIADTSDTLETIRVEVLGKKGALTDILKGLGKVDAGLRPQIGQIANQVKQVISSTIEERLQTLTKKQLKEQLEKEKLDVTLPSNRRHIGHIHPIQQTLDLIIKCFNRLGYTPYDGKDIETNFFNFTALNIPEDHPAQDMHDTFYLKSHGKDKHLLRTHTSPVQIHTMLEEKPPIRILAPGTVYRCDSDTSHSPVFHQIEGLYVDKGVTFSDLKGTLEFFLQDIFGKDKKVRFRPSYFPFTEPSTEVDVQCVSCKGKGCSLCKQTGWIEILGAGIVNRNVFRHVNYDPDEVTGFAFGLGIDRIAMLLFEISDIRFLYENDVRFLKQF